MTKKLAYLENFSYLCRVIRRYGEGRIIEASADDATSAGDGEDERAQENLELKDMVKELRDTHKQDVKTQSNLMKSIDRLTNQVADLTTQNKALQQKVNDLLSQISVGNQ